MHSSGPFIHSQCCATITIIESQNIFTSWQGNRMPTKQPRPVSPSPAIATPLSVPSGFVYSAQRQMSMCPWTCRADGIVWVVGFCGFCRPACFQDSSNIASRTFTPFPEPINIPLCGYTALSLWFIRWWTFGLFPPFDYGEQCRHEPSCTSVCRNTCFISYCLWYCILWFSNNKLLILPVCTLLFLALMLGNGQDSVALWSME